MQKNKKIFKNHFRNRCISEEISEGVKLTLTCFNKNKIYKSITQSMKKLKKF